MIGALLSNTPVNLLRGSGVAGEPEPGPGGNSAGGDGNRASESLASARSKTVRARNTPVLSSQAVLALQETDTAETAGGKPSKAAKVAGNADGQGQDADGNQLSAAVLAGAAGQAALAGGLQDLQSGQEKDEDPDGDGLNEAEEKQVKELAKRDREVRAHEQAHARVGGAYASAPSYTFQQGPDGKRYAIGGEVQIDTARERTPEATIRKMQIVIRAAMAPAEPSSQDLKVAQQARSQLTEAQAELRKQKAEDLKGGDGEDTATTPFEDLENSSPEGEKNSGNGVASEVRDSEEEGLSDQTGREKGTYAPDAIAVYEAAQQQEAAGQSLFSALIG